MALIKCPGCGRDISDRVLSCPQCGYQMQEHLTENAQERNVEMHAEDSVKEETMDAVFKQDKCETDAQMQSTSKLKKRKHIIAAIAGIILVAIIGAAWGFGLLKSNLTVYDISIGDWRVEKAYTSTDLNRYVRTVKSEQKKPFVAVIEQSHDDVYNTEFVYMDEGEGELKSLGSSGVYQDISWKPVGYLDGVAVKEQDIHIEFTDEHYSDSSEGNGTLCTVEISFEITSKETGFLFFDVIDEDNPDNDRINCHVAVFDGKATDVFYGIVLYKSRSNKFKVIPKLFCKSEEVTEKDYTIEKPYFAEKDDHSYKGQEDLAFKEYGDGILIYTRKLLEGGNSEKRNVAEQAYVFVENGKCTIKTNDSIDDEDEALEPRYEFNYVGYIAWTPLKEETK